MAISYADLMDSFSIQSGQFILENIEDATMFNHGLVEKLITRELAIYSRYLPLVVTEMLELYDGKVFDNNPASLPRFKPMLISEIRNKNGLTQYFSFNRFGNISNQYWRYDPETGVFKTFLPKQVYEVKYAVAHQYDPVSKSIPTLNLTDTFFIDMFVGRLMVSIGRSRRSFALNDLPFAQDGEQLVAEGQGIYEKAEQDIQTTSTWMLAAM